MLIDALTGATRQRWTVLGEVSLADPLGDPIAPSTLCLPAYTNGVAGQASVSPSQLASLGQRDRLGRHDHDPRRLHLRARWRRPRRGRAGRPCDAPALERDAAGLADVDVDVRRDQYLLGPDMAFDLEPASRSNGPRTRPTGPPRDGDAPGRRPAGPRRAVPVPARDAGAAPRGAGRDPGAARGVRRRRSARSPTRLGPSRRSRCGRGGSWSRAATPLLSGAARDGLGAIDPVTGAVDPWAPDAVAQIAPRDPVALRGSGDGRALRRRCLLSRGVVGVPGRRPRPRRPLRPHRRRRRPRPCRSRRSSRATRTATATTASRPAPTCG